MDKFLIWFMLLPCIPAVQASWEAAAHYVAAGNTNNAVAWGTLCIGFIFTSIFIFLLPLIIK